MLTCRARLRTELKCLWLRLCGYQRIDVADASAYVLDEFARLVASDPIHCRVKKRLMQQLAQEHFPEAQHHILRTLSDCALHAIIDEEYQATKSQFPQWADQGPGISMAQRIAREIAEDRLLDSLPRAGVLSFAEAAARICEMPEYAVEYEAEKSLVERNRAERRRRRNVR